MFIAVLFVVINVRLRAYRKFTTDYPDYDLDVKLCAFSPSEMIEAQKEYDGFSL